MKKFKVLLSVVLIAVLAFSLTGCFKSTSDFALPIRNGEDVALKDFESVVITNWDSEEDQYISAEIDIKATGFSLIGLSDYDCTIGKDKTVDDDGYVSYERSYEIDVDEREYIYIPEEAEETVDKGVSFFITDWSVTAVKEFDNDDNLAVSVYSPYYGDTDADSVKKDIFKILDAITTEVDVDEEDASIYNLDGISFCNGWRADEDIYDISFYSNSASFTYDDDDIRVYFNISYRTKDYIDSYLEDGGYYENLEKVTDSKGKQIGYVEYDDDSSYCTYYIDVKGDHYMSTMVSFYGDSDDFDILDWSSVEEILTNGKDK